jgi:macrolide transport system ATP-binding/permease protein
MSLIELRNVCKTYHLGEVDVPVLKDVSLSIEQGEFVALMGASGSGKTTLMNLLGCLDSPTSGSYRFDGFEVTRLTRPQLAGLRSSRIGFVFQSFNLLARMTALDNVLMPAAYSSDTASGRQLRQRCGELLATVNLSARTDHSPAQLSGGEQQRVAIARSLVNRPAVLLADEPTGNLDSRTGKEILDLFKHLNREQGITLLLVTHDPEVARHADRIIRISDGQIVEDQREGQEPTPDVAMAASVPARKASLLGSRHLGNSLRMATGAARIALQALRRNVMRTVLTMLGVIIGVAAVIAMMEISQGASTAIQITVSNMGAHTLMISPGDVSSGGSLLSGGARTLIADDALSIEEECPSVICAAPLVWGRGQVVYGNRNWLPRYVMGTTESFLLARNWTEMDLGRPFTEREVRAGSQVCMIGQTVQEELFGDKDPIGQEIRLDNVPFKVVGVLREKGANLLGADQDDILLAPWSTIKYRTSRGYRGGGGSGGNRSGKPGLPGLSFEQRLPGNWRRVRDESISQILVRARSAEALPLAIEEISQLLRDRHRLAAGEIDDFHVREMSEVANAFKNTVRMLSSLALSVAAVSLIVGGVGIMNIMLVSVTERTREIGLRMAVGANATDILRQFLVESIVLCLVGGMIGIAAGRGASLLVGKLVDWPTEPSALAAIVAVVVSVAVGVTFGYYPAWKASRLNPIDALRYE